MRHTVGEGGGGEKVAQERQWYILWGLVPLGEHDGGQMAKGNTNFTIQTQYSPMDFLFNIFTGWISIFSQTVTVTK
jgi:hypothetical protein